MKRILFIFSAVVLLGTKGYSKYWILFNATDGTHGHAFTTFVIQDDETKVFTQIKDIGFGPVDPNYIHFLYQKGTTAYPSERRDMTFYAEVTEKEWQAGLATVEEWSHKTYAWSFQNCTSFLAAVSGNLDGVLVPPSGPLLPTWVISFLKANNKERDQQGNQSFTKANFESGNPFMWETNQTGDSASTAQETAAIKDAATRFFMWYENVWDNKAVVVAAANKKIFYKSALTTGVGKPAHYEGCPCSINWMTVESFFTWVYRNAPLISQSYLDYYKNKLKGLEPELSKPLTEDDFYGAEERFFEAFHFIPGNAGAPQYSKSGIFTEAAVWDIQLSSPSTSTVQVTFKMPSGWFNTMQSYKMEMIKEDGQWKLARNLQGDN